MNVLAVNCGSSSVKFALVAADGADERVLARGAVERLGAGARLAFTRDGQPPVAAAAAVDDQAGAVARILAWLEAEPLPPPDAVGHRVVHGGPRLVAPTRLDDAVVAAIEALEPLAPLHNHPSLAGIRACRAALRAPMVAVFDTAFHATLPEHAARYAIPPDLADRHDVRRYGFHGISYAWATARYAVLAGVPPARATLVALHLGAGASAVAVRDGASVETSMGLTPLEGLVMATRSGDVDPALVGYLARRERVSVEDVERWLNERSGLRGLSGGTTDMRDLVARAGQDARARLAVEVFCHRARKYLGAYLAVLGGAPAVVFTGGIGAHQPEIRRRICADMAWCGLTLDDAKNRATVGVEGTISAPGAAVRVLVIPADEERMIAREVAATLAAAGREVTR